MHADWPHADNGCDVPSHAPASSDSISDAHCTLFPHEGSSAEPVQVCTSDAGSMRWQHSAPLATITQAAPCNQGAFICNPHQIDAVFTHIAPTSTDEEQNMLEAALALSRTVPEVDTPPYTPTTPPRPAYSFPHAASAAAPGHMHGQHAHTQDRQNHAPAYLGSHGGNLGFQHRLPHGSSASTHSPGVLSPISEPCSIREATQGRQGQGGLLMHEERTRGEHVMQRGTDPRAGRQARALQHASRSDVGLPTHSECARRRLNLEMEVATGEPASTSCQRSKRPAMHAPTSRTVANRRRPGHQGACRTPAARGCERGHRYTRPAGSSSRKAGIGQQIRDARRNAAERALQAHEQQHHMRLRTSAAAQHAVAAGRGDPGSGRGTGSSRRPSDPAETVPSGGYGVTRRRVPVLPRRVLEMAGEMDEEELADFLHAFELSCMDLVSEPASSLAAGSLHSTSHSSEDSTSEDWSSTRFEDNELEASEHSPHSLLLTTTNNSRFTLSPEQARHIEYHDDRARGPGSDVCPHWQLGMTSPEQRSAQASTLLARPMRRRSEENRSRSHESGWQASMDGSAVEGMARPRLRQAPFLHAWSLNGGPNR